MSGHLCQYMDVHVLYEHTILREWCMDLHTYAEHMLMNVCVHVQVYRGLSSSERVFYIGWGLNAEPMTVGLSCAPHTR